MSILKPDFNFVQHIKLRLERSSITIKVVLMNSTYNGGYPRMAKFPPKWAILW